MSQSLRKAETRSTTRSKPGGTKPITRKPDFSCPPERAWGKSIEARLRVAKGRYRILSPEIPGKGS